MDVKLKYKNSLIGSLDASGTKTLLTSGKYCEDDIEVVYTRPSPTLETVTKTYTPSTSQQTEAITPGSGYDGIGEVDITVNAMPSGTATTPATTITANPTISVSSGGLITANVSGSQSITPTVSAGYVSSGTAGTVSVSGSNTQQLSVQAAQTITPTTTDQTIESGKYLTGAQTIKGDANLIADNIKNGVQIFGVTGTLPFVDTSDATATAADVGSGKTAYINGSKVTGTGDILMISPDILESYITQKSGSCGNVAYVGAALGLEAITVFRAFFTGWQNSYTATVKDSKNNSYTVSYLQSGSYKIVNFEVEPRRLPEKFTITVSDGTDSYVVIAGPFTYVRGSLASNDPQKLKELSASVYWFGTKAKAYLG